MFTVDLHPLNANSPTGVILAGIYNQNQPLAIATEYLDELAMLADTAGFEVRGRILQRLDRPQSATYLGSGKVIELKNIIEAQHATAVIVDDDLSPSQVRNLREQLEVEIYDRSSLILYIFSRNAKTSQARAQVELAQLQYLLPRLAGMWTHLSRERGGVGMKGAGEKEIETDRRMIRKQIDRLKTQLQQIEKQNITSRKGRELLPRIALVGYTNAGKSTLMNILSKANVLSENRLFATLDTTVRKVYLEGHYFLLSDTVGFIRKLPHHLVESFKSTLAEARESDLFLHLVDVSHPHAIQHIHTVQEILASIGAEEKPVLMVFNKSDLLSDEEKEAFLNSWMPKEHAPFVMISALRKDGIDQLKAWILHFLQERNEAE